MLKVGALAGFFGRVQGLTAGCRIVDSRVQDFFAKLVLRHPQLTGKSSCSGQQSQWQKCATLLRAAEVTL